MADSALHHALILAHTVPTSAHAPLRPLSIPVDSQSHVQVVEVSVDVMHPSHMFRVHARVLHVLACWQKPSNWNAQPIRAVQNGTAPIGQESKGWGTSSRGMSTDNLDTRYRRMIAEKMWQTGTGPSESSFSTSFDSKMRNQSVFDSHLRHPYAENVSRQRAGSGDLAVGSGRSVLYKRQQPRLHSRYNSAHLQSGGPARSPSHMRTVRGPEFAQRR